MKTLLVALVMTFAVQAAEARPEFLGSGKFSRTGSAITVNGPRCTKFEQMDAVRLAVRYQPAYVQEIAVQFQNGRVQRIPIQMNFPANSRTRWIDLRSNGRCVNAVRVIGQSQNVFQKATAEIYGRVRNNNGGNGGWPGGNGGNGGNGGWPDDDDNDGGHNGGHHDGGGHDHDNIQ